jgi:hypothetical protein
MKVAVGVGIYESKVGDEFLADRICDRRIVALELRQPGPQRAFTRGTDFVSDRVIVLQVEQAQKGPKRESLEHVRLLNRIRQRHKAASIISSCLLPAIHQPPQSYRVRDSTFI